jgi:hypothetical protein
MTDAYTGWSSPGPALVVRSFHPPAPPSHPASAWISVLGTTVTLVRSDRAERERRIRREGSRIRRSWRPPARRMRVWMCPHLTAAPRSSGCACAARWTRARWHNCRRVATPSWRGVTRRCPRSTAGRCRMSAASSARSAQSRRGLGVGSAEYGGLVAQDEELDFLGRRCAGEQCQPAQLLAEDQVEQS